MLILAWQSDATVYVALLAFVPVFLLLEHPSLNYNERLLLHIFSFLAVFIGIYYIISWIRQVDPGSHFATVLLRALTIYIPYLTAFFIRFRLHRSADHAALGFCLSWVIIEALHDLNILGLPYGNLGHILGATPGIVQWYAFTGVLGGTIWILLTNFSVYLFIRKLAIDRRKPKKWTISVVLPLFIIVIPPVVSYYMMNKPSDCRKTAMKVAALHTSMDVFDYKYDTSPAELLESYIEQTEIILDTSEQTIIIWPENAITGNINYDQPDSSETVRVIRERLLDHPGTTLVTGAIVRRTVDPPKPDEYAPGIIHDSVSGKYFRRYNTALLITGNKPVVIRTKKRLVPFSEEIPPGRIFAPIVRLVPNLAELSFSRLPNDSTYFNFSGNQNRTSPIICYGSTFSQFVASEIHNTGSNFMVIILNEGWMKSNKAYRHFDWFAVCRAIENRRFLAKSSNEGRTDFISCKGRIIDSITGPVSGVISSSLMINTKETFFTKYHHMIITCIILISAGFLLWIFLNKKHREV